ncbi:MAG: hypothetical protein JWQ04_1368 [Pedosphaera sp.]|nr:hypothetical protein [Pedosphaera sp.]
MAGTPVLIASGIDKPQKTEEYCSSESSNSSPCMAPQNDGCFIEAATDHIRRGAPTDAEHAQGADGESARQIRLLQEWAAQAGRLISLDRFKTLQSVSNRTSEHKVYFDPVWNRAIKQTLPGQFGWAPRLDDGRWTLGIARPLDYLHRWNLFNKVFGDDVQLEGVTITAGPIMIIGENTEPKSAVISQRWHHAADLNHPAPSQAEISMFLRKLGFQSLPNSFHGWHRTADGIVLLDARPDNFIKTEDGVTAIDLPMTRAEVGVGGRPLEI